MAQPATDATQIVYASSAPATTQVQTSLVTITPTLRTSSADVSWASIPTTILASSPSASSTSSPNPSSTSTNVLNIPDTTGGGSSTNIGAIAGGVVGGLAVIGIVIIVLFWIRRRHPRQKAEAPLDDQKTDNTGDEAAMYAHAVPAAELEANPMHATAELDANGNQINELPAGKK